MANGDIIFIYTQIPSSSIMALCHKLQMLFFGNEEEPQKNIYDERNFYKIFDAGRDIDTVIEGVRNILAKATERGIRKPPIDFKQFEKLSEAIRIRNIRSIVCNQPAYFVDDDHLEIEFLEFFTSIDKLEQAFCPSHSISANSALFSLVRQDLDRAVMKLIVQEIGDYRFKAFSLNLMMSTFLSDDFTKFRENLPSKIIGRLYIEIDRADLIEHSDDLEECLARSERLSTPINIDGISHHDWPLLNFSGIPYKFLKMKWSRGISELRAMELEAFTRSINAATEHLAACRT
ncbi:MAG: hypothetical protein HQL37_14705 [Alphaproteobacteria bacterium]|nr:hypothetical protein [Alphaproteobacteria bacterium]